MKIAMLIIRSLLGLLFVLSSGVYFLNLVPTPELTGPMKTFNEGIAASIYFLPLLKGTEMVCGILLLVGRFVPLALVILAPIVIHILMVHLFLAPEGLPIAIFLVHALAFLAYYYRRNFACLFENN